jgi:hypothetical protein
MRNRYSPARRRGGHTPPAGNHGCSRGGLVNAGVARQAAGTLDQGKGLDAVRRGTPKCVREHGSGPRAQLESDCLGNSPDHIRRGRAATCEMAECAQFASTSGLKRNASRAPAGRRIPSAKVLFTSGAHG